MNGARICIVSPGALGSNPRAVKEADALQAAGYRVSVISTRTLGAVDMRDQDILAAARWRSIRLDLRGARWRPWRLLQSVARALHRVTGGTRLGELAFSPFAAPLMRATAKVQADLYIAHYPPALPAAARAAQRHGARYAYDAEDFHLGDLPDNPEYAPVRARIRAVEKRYLSGCAYISAASPGIADAYVRAYGVATPQVILNVFARADAPGAVTRAGTVPGPSLYWFSQTIGADRGLECAIRALAIARSRPHLYLRGTLAVGFADTIAKLAAQAGVADRCHILPPAPPSQMAKLAQDYDLGLAGETNVTLNRGIALTNKAFTYFLGGVPVAMSDIAAHRWLAEQSPGVSALYTMDDPESLAATMDHYLMDPELLAQSRAAAYALGQQRFNWDMEKNLLLARVAQALQDRAYPGNNL